LIASLPEPPAVVLLDLAIADGLQQVRRLVERLTHTRTVALAVREVDEEVIRWAEAGVDAVVTREASLEALQNTVECVVEGQSPCSPRVGAALMRRLAELSASHPTAPRANARLTTRERQVGDLLRNGLTNKEIAATLFIELSTVKHHVHNVLEKLEARSRAEAAGKISAWREDA
jgi:DNA-binding NarL/FixJ family response regulator